jgi:hypothetical protein
MSDSHPTAARRLGRFAPSRLTLLWGALIVLVELLAVLLYLELAPVEPMEYRIYAYPFVWINVGLWAIVATDPPAGVAAVQRRAAGMVAGGYFLLLSYAGGVVAGGYSLVGGTPGFYAGLRTLPPGWGPVLLWNTPVVKLTVYPYKLIGYLALAYLVYVLVLDAAGASSAFGGVLGLLSCVSCSWPVLTTLVTGVVGSGSALAAAANSEIYGLSTLVFVVTVALLHWRPTVGGG